MISVLVGCGLRRAELSALPVEDLQIRQGHWAIVDLVGKGGHVRTVPDACLGQGGSRSLEGVREGEHGSNLPRSQTAWDALAQGYLRERHLVRGAKCR